MVNYLITWTAACFFILYLSVCAGVLIPRTSTTPIPSSTPVPTIPPCHMNSTLLPNMGGKLIHGMDTATGTYSNHETFYWRVEYPENGTCGGDRVQLFFSPFQSENYYDKLTLWAGDNCTLVKTLTGYLGDVPVTDLPVQSTIFLKWHSDLSIVAAGFNMTYIIGCAAGTYPNSTGHCELCLAGSYRATPGACSVNDCLICPISTFASVDRKQCLSACPIGTGSLNNNTCSTCAPGTYSSSSDTAPCSQCSIGIAPLSGQASCQPCGKGQIPSSSHIVCDKCPQDTYKLNETYCEPCPPGRHSYAGSDSATMCVDVSFPVQENGLTSRVIFHNSNQDGTLGISPSGNIVAVTDMCQCAPVTLRLYNYTSDQSWVVKTTFNPSSSYYYGEKVAVNDMWLVVLQRGNGGKAIIYNMTDLYHPTTIAFHGADVWDLALHDNTIAVSAALTKVWPGYGSATHIYTFEGTWKLVDVLVPDWSNVSNSLTYSVQLTEKYVAILCHVEDIEGSSSHGVTHVYERKSSSIVEVARLSDVSCARTVYLSMSPALIVTSCQSNANYDTEVPGSITVWSVGTWQKIASISTAEFGVSPTSLKVIGSNRIYVGMREASLQGYQSGAVALYEKIGGQWKRQRLWTAMHGTTPSRAELCSEVHVSEDDPSKMAVKCRGYVAAPACGPGSSPTIGDICGGCRSGQSTGWLGGTSYSQHCTDCLAGTFNSGAGGMCTACPSSSVVFSDDGATSCSICPSGSYCALGKRIACPAGTFNDIVGATTCHPCIVKSSCIGGDKCLTGWDPSNACSKCAPQFFPLRGKCLPCPSSALLLVLAGLVLTIAVFALATIRVPPIAMTKIKSVITLLQGISLSLSIDISWPPLLTWLRDVVSALTVDIDYISPSCFLPSTNWKDRFWLAFVVSVTVPIVVTVLFTIVRYVRQRLAKGQQFSMALQSVVSDVGLASSSSINRVHTSVRFMWWRRLGEFEGRMSRMLLLVYTIAVVPACKLTLMITRRSCIPGRGTMVFLQDPSIDCGDPELLVMSDLSTFLMLLFLFSPLLVALWNLCSYFCADTSTGDSSDSVVEADEEEKTGAEKTGAEKADEETTDAEKPPMTTRITIYVWALQRDSISPITESYTSGACLWEFIVLFRKALIALWVTGMNLNAMEWDDQWQLFGSSMGVFGIVLIFHVLPSLAGPFAPLPIPRMTNILNHVDVLGGLIAMLTALWGGLALVFGSVIPQWLSLLISIIIIILTVIALLLNIISGTLIKVYKWLFDQVPAPKKDKPEGSTFMRIMTALKSCLISTGRCMPCVSCGQLCYEVGCTCCECCTRVSTQTDSMRRSASIVYLHDTNLDIMIPESIDHWRQLQRQFNHAIVNHDFLLAHAADHWMRRYEIQAATRFEQRNKFIGATMKVERLTIPNYVVVVQCADDHESRLFAKRMRRILNHQLDDQSEVKYAKSLVPFIKDLRVTVEEIGTRELGNRREDTWTTGNTVEELEEARNYDAAGNDGVRL